MLRFLLVYGQGQNIFSIKKLKFALKYIDIDLQEKK